MNRGADAAVHGRRSSARRRLAAIMFADVVGYSRLVAEDEVRTLVDVRVLRRRVIDPRIIAHGGRPFAARGDGFVAEFPSAVEAVACAAAIQYELIAGSPAPETSLRGALSIRIGINIGDVAVDPDGELLGDNVNIAARLQDLAEPGGIVISGKTYDELQGRLTFPFENAGERVLKNIPSPVPMFSLSPIAISELPISNDRHATPTPRPAWLRTAGLSVNTFTVAGMAILAAWWLLATPSVVPSPTRTATGASQPQLGPAQLSTSLSKPVVAVLPLANLSREDRWDRLCDGLSTDIITGLTLHPDLLVVAQHSAFAFRNKESELRDVGRALGARYVLTGNVQVDATRLRVTAQLIEAESGTHIWAGRYDRNETDLFVVQDEVVNQVVAAIAGYGGALLRAELRLAKRRHPANLQAYELYLLGYEQEARLDREGTLKSIELETAALQIDPGLSRAWTVLGWALGTAATQGWIDAASARRRSAEAVRKAAEFDPGDGVALAELSILRAREGDLAGATMALERALIVGANQADTLVLLSRPMAGVLGRVHDALSLIKQAFALNPRLPDWYLSNYARVAYFASQFETALDASRRAPPLMGAQLFQLLALAQLNRPEETAAAAEAFRKAFPDFDGDVYAARLPLIPKDVRSLFMDGVRKAGLNAG